MLSFFLGGGGVNLKLGSEMSNIKCAVSERVNWSVEQDSKGWGLSCPLWIGLGSTE
jgi:hypothetical protein